MIDYKVGQEVVVKSRKGPLLWNFRRGFYDYRRTRIKDAPLGMTGIIKEIYDGKRYGELDVRLENGLTKHFINEEVNLSNAEKRRIAAEIRKQQELEEILRQQEKEEIAAESINELLTVDAPSDIKTEGDKVFKPEFNAREEFAIWLRKQFPDLPESRYFTRYDHTNRGWEIEYPGSYKFPKERKEDIYKAAILACDHGISTADGCVQGYFRDCLKKLDKDFDKAVFCLLNLIENVSTNLAHERIHYGTKANNGATIT